MTLINDASLQSKCNKEGFNFNAQCVSYRRKSRIGILGNEQENCNTCDSVIGHDHGIEITNWLGSWKWSSGNTRIHPEIKTLETFGYIFVR